MTRSLAIVLAAGLATGLAMRAAAQGHAVESLPSVHNEPISVRILNADDGKPLAHVHLVLIAGYDMGEIHDQLWREETLTDDRGEAQLSRQFANLPFLQVWVTKRKLCQQNPGAKSFSVETIRRDGVSAPNRCGIATVENAPGVFTVFVKVKPVAPPAGAGADDSSDSPEAAPDAAQTPAQIPAKTTGQAPAPAALPAPASVPSPAAVPAQNPNPDPVPTQITPSHGRSIA
jgi:hypothetical protein